MRVLLVADAGDGLLDLALRSQQAGHEARLFVRKYDRVTRPIGKGLVELVPDWHPWIRWADLTILESNGFSMREFGAWRDRGCQIIGGNAESAAWELDRKKGMEIFRRAGIAVPPFREFAEYDAAIGYVESRGEVYFSKPCSDSADKSLSAKTGVPAAPAWQLHKWKKKHGRPPCPFLLQESVEGVEFAVGAWFGPAGFHEGYEENFEHKRFAAGDIGPNTGEMGTVSRYVRRSKLGEAVLRPLEGLLEEIGYVGNIDVNAIVDQAGDVWPLEFTMRLGWPAFNLETDLFACDPIEFLHALASGESTRGAHRLNEVAVGVVAAIPPYPHPPRDYDDIVGVPIYGLEGFQCTQGQPSTHTESRASEPRSSWHPCEVMGFTPERLSKGAPGAGKKALGEAPGATGGQSAGSRHNHGSATIKSPNAIQANQNAIQSTAGHYVGVAVGTGPTVRQASRGAYKVLERLSMPASPFWRDDIGRRLQRDLPKLQEHGFAAGMEY